MAEGGGSVAAGFAVGVGVAVAVGVAVVGVGAAGFADGLAVGFALGLAASWPGRHPRPPTAGTTGGGAVACESTAGFGVGSAILVSVAGRGSGGALATAPPVPFRVVKRNTAAAPPGRAGDREERDDQALLAARDGDVGDDLRVAREHEVLAGLDEAQPDVAEIDDVAAAELDLAVVLAVDAHAVRRLQVADRVAAGVGLARELRVVAADRAMVDDEVVLVGAADDHLRPRQLELLAGEVRRQDDEAAGARAGAGGNR